MHPDLHDITLPNKSLAPRGPRLFCLLQKDLELLQPVSIPFSHVLVSHKATPHAPKSLLPARGSGVSSQPFLLLLELLGEVQALCGLSSVVRDRELRIECPRVKSVEQYSFQKLPKPGTVMENIWEQFRAVGPALHLAPDTPELC